MAAIDKTYVSSYKEWKEIVDWMKSHSFTIETDLTNDNIIIQLKNYILYPDATEEEINNWLIENAKNLIKYRKQTNPDDTTTLEEALKLVNIPVINTPTYVDIYLIRNCHIQLIQDTMKSVYGKDEYERIKNGISDYDTYERNGLKNKFHYTVLKKPNFRYYHCFWYRDRCGNLKKYKENKDTVWDVTVYSEGDFWWAHNEHNYWTNTRYEALPYDCNIMHVKGKMSIKKIIRLIKKWNLPAGVTVNIVNFRFNIEYKIRLKK